MRNEFMQMAIDEAYDGIKNREGGPFGCVIVRKGIVVGRGHNQVVENNDCTCHGEMQAIRNACANLSTFDLSGCELYTTSAPCPMCKGAIQWARIKKVYYGCDINDAARIGFDDKEFFETDLEGERVDYEDCKALFDVYEKLDHTMY